MKSKLALLFSLVLSAGVAFAQGISTGSSHLNLPFGARSAALGEATVADNGHLSSWLVNPANLGTTGQVSVLLTHSQWIQDVRSQYVGTQVPLTFGTIGFIVSNSSVSGIEIRETPGPPLGTFTAHFAALQGGFARNIHESIVAGVSLKYVYEKLYVDEATGFGLDVGLTYLTPMRGLSVGLAVTNLGELGKFRSDPSRLPAAARVGGSYLLGYDDFEFGLHAAMANDLHLGKTHAHVGAETSYQGIVALRLGYETGFETRGISAGLGVRYSLVSLDYAYVPFSLGLGSAHLFSIGFQF
ncbi:MAG: PorV/PorQ family protein [Ignavibacteria bacterium]|nr:PorV/PorQ family protein [Ignavibacteria bacterium]